jgi:hypothetical protein
VTLRAFPFARFRMRIGFVIALILEVPLRESSEIVEQ